LGRCLAEHEQCAVGKPVGFRPTRLMDLRPFHDSGDVRVVRGRATTGEYATLSYCWGGIAPLVLEPSSHDAFRKRIAWDDLPKTMQDAVMIAKRLDVRYLWIDALCIIQGPDGDFQKEASRMRAVYSGSLFTIAAAESSNPHGGCFRNRTPLRFTDCRIYDDNLQVIYVGARSPCTSIPRYGHPDQCRLAERAWCFQERMLSPRTLFFDRDLIHFECREGLLCESCPEYKDHESNYQSATRLHRELTSMSPRRREKSIQSFRRLWRIILPQYSATKLSHQDDRLSAIAGIVSSPQELLNLEAAFGLWTAFFVDELCWCAHRWLSEDDLRQNWTPPKHIPTWSWMRLSNA
ncbi:HET-domain-containing protein, partial [Byssothecium circinans]